MNRKIKKKKTVKKPNKKPWKTMREIVTGVKPKFDEKKKIEKKKAKIEKLRKKKSNNIINNYIKMSILRF